MIKMTDPYDVVVWNSRSGSEPKVFVSHWQELKGRDCYGIYYRCFVFTYNVLMLLTLCAVILTLLKQVVWSEPM